ncbi:arsenate reductase [Thioalkalivibrio sp. ALJ16]|uniref:arsenate reductase n=1 Tax=Thioalkalivibrio sp. ALJ16 TaxID=1158762 RepID=UPI0003712A25|nr:arsenate reductase [Thioalkalivibrio sp. ALJ16]
MSEVTLYGIANCDTVRKARRALDAAGVSVRFVDLRKDGLEPARLQRWVEVAGWEALVNRRGTTWRQLPEDERSDMNADRALALMQAHPTLIKRPVIEHGANGEALEVGWNTAVATRLGAA